MQGLGKIKMKGKLTKRPGCGCCFTWKNTKKTSIYEDRTSYKKEGDRVFYSGQIGYDGTDERPDIAKLFPNGRVKIWVDGPFDDTVWLDNRYYGYVEQWEEYIEFAKSIGEKYRDYRDLKEIFSKYYNRS